MSLTTSTIPTPPDRRTAGLPRRGSGDAGGGALQSSFSRGKRIGNNSRQATGLSWQIASPPLTENFIRTPVADHEAHDGEWLGHRMEQEVVTVG